ncbi:hypothetical protein [Streptomyces sp. ISL-11]|uniref:hypothetical protein n=1 Tax=Streptomyces sp. ISL-11 TaxID=2819174 RepID=UPI001BEA2ADD|nr:hypothetical protein [Streptomyces sp. ISL-11]MBT2387702.1 hypothetical protein [Streptomyces sp. ISL-11]
MHDARFPATSLEAVVPDAVALLRTVDGDRRATATVRGELREQAVQDASCQREVRLDAAVRRAQGDAQQAVLRGKRREDLGHLRELRRQALATALRDERG